MKMKKKKIKNAIRDAAKTGEQDLYIKDHVEYPIGTVVQIAKTELSQIISYSKVGVNERYSNYYKSRDLKPEHTTFIITGAVYENTPRKVSNWVGNAFDTKVYYNVCEISDPNLEFKYLSFRSIIFPGVCN